MILNQNQKITIVIWNHDFKSYDFKSFPTLGRDRVSIRDKESPIWTRSPIWSYQFWRLLNSDRRSEPNTVLYLYIVNMLCECSSSKKILESKLDSSACITKHSPNLEHARMTGQNYSCYKIALVFLSWGPIHRQCTKILSYDISYMLWQKLRCAKTI